MALTQGPAGPNFGHSSTCNDGYAQSGKLLSSAIDARDHEYILGSTEDIEPLAETLQVMEMNGATGAEIDAYEAKWVKEHKLVTFDEGQSRRVH